jgi:hypothetical protein
MQADGLLDTLPLWAVFLVTVVVIVLSVEIGHRAAMYLKKRSEEEKDASVGAMVGATLGLLAFMLAFTFGMAASLFQSRRERGRPRRGQCNRDNIPARGDASKIHRYGDPQSPA